MPCSLVKSGIHFKLLLYTKIYYWHLIKIMICILAEMFGYCQETKIISCKSYIMTLVRCQHIYFSIDDRIQTLALDIYGHCSKSSFIIVMIFLLFYNMASKLVQFQSRNLRILLACPIILWRHADGAMNSLKCIYVS